MEVWGRDCDIAFSKKTENHPLVVDQLIVKKPLSKKIPESMIRFFQVYISPIDGPRSSYSPASSQYALQAIGKYGFFKGVAVGCDRLLRENGYLWVYETGEVDGMMRKIDPVR